MQERETAFADLGKQGQMPRVAAFRFGTVVGVSPSQRVDLIFPSHVKAACHSGVLAVRHGETSRTFLYFEDLAKSFDAVPCQSQTVKRGVEILNLGSFKALVCRVASSIAATTGARIGISNVEQPIAGFMHVPDKFKDVFNSTLWGALEKSVGQLDRAIPDSISGKGCHQEPPLKMGTSKRSLSIPCPVCGSHDIQNVLDLLEQSLAKDFRETRKECSLRSRVPSAVSSVQTVHPHEFVHCRQKRGPL